jgi:hypothetical protein
MRRINISLRRTASASALAILPLFYLADFSNSGEASITQQTVKLQAELNRLNWDAPQKDVEFNWRHHDKRFIGVKTFSCSPSGVAQSDWKYVFSKEYGIRCLEGTSDMAESEYHITLINKAIKYAESYNQELLKRIRSR